jgi:hypothetical protein
VLSDDEFEQVKRIADALTRLADRFAPSERRERKASHLGTAAYSEEERDRLRLLEELRAKTPKPA